MSFPALPPDPDKECSDYERLLLPPAESIFRCLESAATVISFNEPADSFPQATHIVDLTESTIDANKRFLRARTMCRARR